jgi:hypothetical protein
MLITRTEMKHGNQRESHWPKYADLQEFLQIASQDGTTF